MSTSERKMRERKIKAQRALHRRAMEARAAAEAEQRARQAREDWMRFLVARGAVKPGDGLGEVS